MGATWKREKEHMSTKGFLQFHRADLGKVKEWETNETRSWGLKKEKVQPPPQQGEIGVLQFATHGI